MLEELRKAVEAHSGTFHCTEIGNETKTKDVEFRHVFDPPFATDVPMPSPKMADFYRTFSRLSLYHVSASDEAAIYIGSPDEWPTLEGYFRDWTEDLSKEEEEELLPPWIHDCVVIGEIPSSGNYLLVPLSGEQQGFVFEFEHDGFEFIELAPDIETFVHQLLDPDPRVLTAMASHMRFVEEHDLAAQWWIAQMRDNRGNMVSTRA